MTCRNRGLKLGAPHKESLSSFCLPPLILTFSRIGRLDSSHAPVVKQPGVRLTAQNLNIEVSHYKLASFHATEGGLSHLMQRSPRLRHTPTPTPIPTPTLSQLKTFSHRSKVQLKSVEAACRWTTGKTPRQHSPTSGSNNTSEMPPP